MSELNKSTASLQTYPAGAVIIPEGGQLNTLYVLKHGEVEVFRDGTTIAFVSQPGAIFGEMSVLLETPHTATVRATVDTQVYAIINALAVLEARPAWCLQIARLLARRVQATTAALVITKQVEPLLDNLVLPAPMVAQLDDARGWGDPTI